MATDATNDAIHGHRHLAANDSTARHKNDYSTMNSAIHIYNCTDATEKIVDAFGEYSVADWRAAHPGEEPLRDMVVARDKPLVGRELTTEEERALASGALEAFNTSNMLPVVDESVPRFEPYDPRDDDGSLPWKRRVWLCVEITKTFPWLTITRY